MSRLFSTAVVVRELSEAPECFLFNCCILIATFTLLSCYSSANTRIQPVKSYQINESFCLITCFASLSIVYCLITVLMCSHCPEHQCLHFEFTTLLQVLNPNMNLNHTDLNCILQSHFSVACFDHTF